MFQSTTQKENNTEGGDVVAGNKTVNHNNFKKPTRLATLFTRLQKDHFDGRVITSVSDNLNKFQVSRDMIGLEQKLINGGRAELIDDAEWLKQEYLKKLTKFQFFEPAQEIHAMLLSTVLSKFTNLIYPLMKKGETEEVINRVILEQIVEPISKTIEEEGCEDVMGLCPTDIEGMIYYLTGLCHIKWMKSDDHLSPGL